MTRTPNLEEVALPLCELRSVKTRAGKESYGEITVRLPLGEAFERAVAFLVRCQENDHPVNVTIAEVQTRMLP